MVRQAQVYLNLLIYIKKIEIKNYIDKSRMRTSGGETNYILTLKHFNF